MEKRSNEELAVLAQNGDPDAFELLWKQTEGFVYKKITELKEKYNFDIGRHMRDLKLCGKLGIAEGMERFDITRGTTFLTYAGWWVIKELMLYVDEEIKHQREIPFAVCRGEIWQQERDYFKKDINIRAMEDTAIREYRLQILKESLEQLPPRERLFAKYRYGFLDAHKRSIRQMCEEFHLSMREFRALERTVHEYLYECLCDFCVYPWEEQSAVIDTGQAQEEAAQLTLFENPAGNYLSQMLDTFQDEWEWACEWETGPQ